MYQRHICVVISVASAASNMEYVLNAIGFPQVSLKRAFSPVVDFGRHIRDHFIPHAHNNYHPHVLGHRSLGLMSGLLISVRIFSLALVSFGPVLPAFSSAITTQNIISLTNESRQQFSIPALTENSLLNKAAQQKADDMLQKGYFAHNSPDGRTPWDFITATGYGYLMAGENLAVNFTEAENVESAWMNSPGHKANILNKNFVEIGIGIAQGTYQDHTAIFVVQEFGLPSAQKVALTDAPTKVRTAAVPAPSPVPALAEAKPSQEVKSAKVPVAQPAPAPALTPLQTLTGTQVQPPDPVTVESGNVRLQAGGVEISAQVLGPAVKVLAYFGRQAIMLEPKDQTTWSGQAVAGDLAGANSSIKLEAFGMQGQTAQFVLADFAKTTQANYNLSGTTPTSFVTFMGQTFNPKVFENRFYLFFIAGLLSSLILAIGLKRHIQHLSLIANSSFVAIFACLLWMAG